MTLSYEVTLPIELIIAYEVTLYFLGDTPLTVK